MRGKTGVELPGMRGKVAVVTGSGGGIGEAYATGLAAAGARVVVAGIDRGAGERVAGVNVNGVLLCARACVPSMKARGGGAIVNQSSTAAWMAAGFYGLAAAGITGQVINVDGGQIMRP
jgi:NAD(P)-dependent dehydrogenase (short-subunit alcohol dehydrogenase family)